MPLLSEVAGETGDCKLISNYSNLHERRGHDVDAQATGMIEIDSCDGIVATDAMVAKLLNISVHNTHSMHILLIHFIGNGYWLCIQYQLNWKKNIPVV